jgi:hypothetical protein
VITLKDEVVALNGILLCLKMVAEELEADATFNNATRLQHVNSCLAMLYKLQTSWIASTSQKDRKSEIRSAK